MTSPHAPSDQRSPDSQHTIRCLQRAMMATLSALLLATPAKSDSCDLILQVHGDYEGTPADHLEIHGGCPAQASLSHEGFASAAVASGASAARARAADSVAEGSSVGNDGESGTNFSFTDFLIAGPTATVNADVSAKLELASLHSVAGEFGLLEGGASATIEEGGSVFISASCLFNAFSSPGSGSKQRTCLGAFLSCGPDIDESTNGPASIGCSTTQNVDAQVELPVGEQFSITIKTRAIGIALASPGTASSDSHVRATLIDIQVPEGYTITLADGSPLPVGGFDTVNAPVPAPAVPAMAASGRFAVVALMLLGSMIALQRRR